MPRSLSPLAWNVVVEDPGADVENLRTSAGDVRTIVWSDARRRHAVARVDHPRSRVASPEVFVLLSSAIRLDNISRTIILRRITDDQFYDAG